MMRLTPDKLRGYHIPKHRRDQRINRGNTSIIYTTDDPDKLEVFTVEQMKMEWWQESLGIIDSYEEVADATYCGFGYDYSWKYKRIVLPVYHCFVQRLDMPTQEHRRIIRAIRKECSNAQPPYNHNQPTGLMRHDWWLNLYNNATAPQLRDIAEFALNYDSDHITPDVGAGDFALMDGKLVILDPFHHLDVNEAFSLIKNNPDRHNWRY